MAEAEFDHGEYATKNYTPSGGDVAAGEVVLLGNTTGLTCGIAHRPIVNNVEGALAVGGGHYRVVNLNNAANDAKVWWDDSANKVTTVSTNNALFGFITEDGAGGANSTCIALHKPYV
jgi:hypothetical protein